MNRARRGQVRRQSDAGRREGEEWQDDMGAPRRNRPLELVGRREETVARGRKVAACPIPDRLLLEPPRLIAGFFRFALRMFQLRQRGGSLGEEGSRRRRWPGGQ